MTTLETITDRPLEEISVDELRLGVRGKKRLEQLGIRTLDDFLNLYAEDILGKNFGKLSLDELRRELQKYDLVLKTRKQREHEKICKAIINAISNGVRSQTEIARLINMDANKMIYRAKVENIQLPIGNRGAKPKIIPQRDIDIVKGLWFGEYGRRWGISRQGAEIYIKHPDRYRVWQNARLERMEGLREWKELEKEEPKTRVGERERLLWVAYKRAKEIDDWTYQRAIEYCILIKRQTGGQTGIPFKKLLRLFENYELVYENNEEPNYRELSKKSKIKRETVKKVIKTIEPWLEID